MSDQRETRLRENVTALMGLMREMNEQTKDILALDGLPEAYRAEMTRQGAVAGLAFFLMQVYLAETPDNALSRAELDAHTDYLRGIVEGNAADIEAARQYLGRKRSTPALRLVSKSVSSA